MSTMSASPVKPVMPPPGVPNATKVIPSSAPANASTPGVLQNPVPASPPKNSAPPPIGSVLAVSLPATPTVQNSITPPKQIQSQNANRPVTGPVPLSLITNEHKLTASPTVQSIPATVQPSLAKHISDKQASQGEGYMKPTSNGVEDQVTAHRPVSLTITPVPATGVTPPPAVIPQQPLTAPSETDTTSSDHPVVSCPSESSAGRAATNSPSSFTALNPIKTDSTPPSKQDSLSVNQPAANSFSSPATAPSPLKLSPVSQTSLATVRSVSAASDKNSSDSVSASSAVPTNRSETAGNPLPAKADAPVVNKPERAAPAEVGKGAIPPVVTSEAASVPSPEKAAPASSGPADAVEPPSGVESKSAPASTTSTDGGRQSSAQPADDKVGSSDPSDKDQNVSKTKPNEPTQPQTPFANSVPVTPAKSELKVATIPRGSKRKRETKQNSTPVQQNTPASAATSAQRLADSSKSDSSDDRKSKRVRLPTQPYQSPLPEFSLIAKMNKSTPTKSVDDKLIVFYKNEFLAVRNADGGFYICQAMQNIYKSSPKIRIRWLSQEASTEVYSPDFYDTTDFDCILTNLNMERVEKEKFRLPPVELHRTESILKRALDFEKGVSEKPSVTEEHPDGLDLSLFRDESQLKKTSKRGSGSTPAAKGPHKKSSRLSRATSDKESDEQIEDAQSDEEKKRKKDSVSVSKANKKSKKQSVKKKSQSGGKKPASKSLTSVKSLPSKKKKRKAAPVAPASVEPVKSTVKRKLSTSTPPAPNSTTKRAKKAEGATPQVEEKSSKTRNSAMAQTASKNRTTNAANPTSADKTTGDNTASVGGSTRTGSSANVAGKEGSSVAAVTAVKDNRERRTLKSRK